MSERTNEPGFLGWDEQKRQQCLRCWGWKFPVIHSCPGVPQVGRQPPPVAPETHCAMYGHVRFGHQLLGYACARCGQLDAAWEQRQDGGWYPPVPTKGIPK